jgi:cysteine desulfurase/selenocysteine lyase
MSVVVDIPRILSDKPRTELFDVDRIREDFPILNTLIRGKPLVYLDNSATSQKPASVIDTLNRYYRFENSNIHRGVHYLSMQATEAYEDARIKVQEFINASSQKEIIFVRGTTEGINLVARSFARDHIHAGDEILISAMEHHSNIVPWQLIAEERGAILKVIPMNEDGEIIIEEYELLLTERTKIVAIVHVSNSLGTVNPVKQMIRMAHQKNIPVLIDGAQAVPHLRIDVQDLDCDFYAFSGHKMYAPTGVGVLYGKRKWLESFPPYQGGGDMIKSVTFEKTIYNDLPYKFEAGTPNISGGIGLGAAIDYLNNIGLDHINAYEHELLTYATDVLSAIPGLKIIGTAKEKAGAISFVLENVHPHDVGSFLDMEGIAIRTGHHCTQPVMHFFGIPATSRASLAFYNKKEEIDVLDCVIRRVREVFE